MNKLKVVCGLEEQVGKIEYADRKEQHPAAGSVTRIFLSVAAVTMSVFGPGTCNAEMTH